MKRYTLRMLIAMGFALLGWHEATRPGVREKVVSALQPKNEA